jgi:hypothetical protein
MVASLAPTSKSDDASIVFSWAIPGRVFGKPAIVFFMFDW